MSSTITADRGCMWVAWRVIAYTWFMAVCFGRQVMTYHWHCASVQ